jgi:hypothetical protein
MVMGREISIIDHDTILANSHVL